MRHLLHLVFLWTLGCAPQPKDAGDSSPSHLEDACLEAPEDRSDGWGVGRPIDLALDDAALCGVLDDIAAGDIEHVDHLLIAKDGVLVVDALFRSELDDFDFLGNTDLEVHDVQSVTKSFNAVLVGLALHQGYLSSVDALVLPHFPEYFELADAEPAREAWTVEDFLTMRTGLEWDEWTAPWGSDANSLSYTYNNTYDYVRALLSWPMREPPGEAFTYCTICSLTIGAVVERAVGAPIEDYLDAELFGPLGVDSDQWIFTPTGLPNTGGGLLLSGRDTLKFGQLFLQDGVWGGQRLLPEGWVSQVTAEHVVFEGALAELGRGYGYQWWLDDLAMDGEPLGIYSAQGAGGQAVYVWPERGVVVVIAGDNYEGQVGENSADVLMQSLLLAL